MSSTYRLQKTDYYRYLLQTQIFVLIVCIKLMRTFRQRKNMNMFQTSIFFVKKQKFVIIVYGKKTISDVYTNFIHNSFISQTYKTVLIKSLLFQCFRLCSDFVIFHHEINILKSHYPLEELYIYKATWCFPAPASNFFIKKSRYVFMLKKLILKKFLIFFQRKNFLIFQEIELSSPNINFFFSKKFFSDILGSITFQETTF